jgi:hypothetical protein
MVNKQNSKTAGDGAFKERKQKVGKKKLAPVSATRAEVHARTLRVVMPGEVLAEQERQRALGVAQCAAEEGVGNVGAKVIRECLANVGHYRSNQRLSGFVAALKWLQNPPNRLGLVAPVRTLQLLEAALASVTDTEDDSRTAAVACIVFLSNHTLQANPAMRVPVAPVFLRHLNVALTHASKMVRQDALDAVGRVLLPHGCADVPPEVLGNNFLQCCCAQPELRDELLVFLVSVTNVAVGLKKYMPLAAVAACLFTRHVAAPGDVLGNVTGGPKNPFASTDIVNSYTTDFISKALQQMSELLALKGALFRLPEKLSIISGITRTVGAVLPLARPSMSRDTLTALRRAFVDHVPFTVAELCARGGPALQCVVALTHTNLHLVGNFHAARASVSGCTSHLLDADNNDLGLFTFGLRCLASLVAVPPPSGEYETDPALAPAALLALLPAAMERYAARADGAPVLSRCIDTLHVAFTHGLLAAGSPAAGVVAALTKVLFLSKRGELPPAHREAFVRRCTQFFTLVLTDRSDALCPAARVQLHKTMPSLFALADAVPGVLGACGEEARTGATHALFYSIPAAAAGDPLPPHVAAMLGGTMAADIAIAQQLVSSYA